MCPCISAWLRSAYICTCTMKKLAQTPKAYFPLAGGLISISGCKRYAYFRSNLQVLSYIFVTRRFEIEIWDLCVLFVVCPWAVKGQVLIEPRFQVSPTNHKCFLLGNCTSE